MIIPKFMGGLGNQMFQIAAAKAHALRNNTQFKVCEAGHVLPYQGFKFKKYKNSIFRSIQTIDSIPTGIKRYDEPHVHYKKIPDTKDLFIVGYFQSEKYFKDYETIIKNLFSIPEAIKEDIYNKYPQIYKDSVSLHVRRGDYVGLQGYHGLQTVEYYSNALECIGKSKNVFIFSDDIKWCKENLKVSQNFIEEDDYISLYMMSLCENNILANSSFSWWGAWLNENQNKKVVAPKKWFGPNGPKNTQDIIPEEWIKI